MTSVAPSPGWQEQIAADTAGNLQALAAAAHRARAAYAQQQPARAQELRQALDVAQGARQEATAAAAALERFNQTPPTSREALDEWAEQAETLARKLRGLQLLAEQAERRASDLRRLYDQAVGALVLRELEAGRHRAAALHREHGERVAELLRQLQAARNAADRELAALLAEAVEPWEGAATAMELEHFQAWAWRDKLRRGAA